MATPFGVLSTPFAASVDGANDVVPFWQVSTNSAFSITRNKFLNLTSQPVGTTDVLSLSNKTLDNTNVLTVQDSNFTLQDNVDTTKQAQFQLSGITTGTTRTYTLPNASVTLASLTGTEVLTNKTLTSPTITGGSIDNSTITVDTISGHTSATVVTVGGVQLTNGTIGTSGAVTSTSIAAGAVIPNSLVASSGSGWGWQTFTPTWTNFTQGNGTVTAKYGQTGKTVIVQVYFNLGTTSAVSGDISFVPPVTASGRYNSTGNNVVGFGYLSANTGNGIAAPFFNGTNTAIHIGYFASGTALTASSASAPGTWATNGNADITVIYEAA